MKTYVPIVWLAACILSAEETQRDPFAPAMKTAAELIRCASGHKALRDVPIVYGLIGGLKGDPVTAAKAERGEIILGGCIGGGQDHLVVCKTCGLRYSDLHEAWEESFPPDPFAPESKKNPLCTAETIRQKVSKEIKDIALSVAGEPSTFRSCTRWLDASGLVGEQVLILTEAKTEEIQTKLEAWMRNRGAPKNPILDKSDIKDRRWEWTHEGKSFLVDMDASDNGASDICLEWHVQKREAEQAAPSDGDRPQK